VIDNDGSNFARECTQDWRLAILAEPKDYSRIAYSIDQVVDDVPQVIDAMSEQSINMSPERVKAIREGLGLTQVALAATLRLGPTGKRSVIRWETGDTPVPGPVSVALEALASGWEPGSHYGPNARAEQAIRDLESAVLQAQEQVRQLRLTPKGQS
jgi:DNA-binding transcriptional regulator YiaG